ncbi:MAG: hypothetical protein HY244_11870 [Rhizobiales bacterium]|nr:hypothetical protein [Hyphomicrobiales bacterium]
MSQFVRRSICMVGFLLALATPLRAQENLDSNKTPQQLYASDCAVCHKSPQGLAARGGGFGGLEGFLREHYTASRESAAAIAGYLRAVGGAPAASGRVGKGKGKKGDDKAKGSEKKPGEAKTGDGKSGDDKAGEAKSGEGKPAKPKSAAPKSSDAKSSDAKSSEKSSEAKPVKPKLAKPKPAESNKTD